MKNKLVLGLVSSLLFTTAAPLMGNVVQAEESLEELKKEKEAIEDRSEELGSVIEETESEMSALEQERQELETNIQSLQITIEGLTKDIETQEERLEEKNKEIEELNKEIEKLTEAIELRNEKLQTQARATQTKWNPANIVHMIISAEDLSDLIGRMGIIGTLVSANQTIIEDQQRDQEALVEAESKIQVEKEQVETLLVEVKANREELSLQQTELDNEIMYVAERYQMNATEKDQFVSDQFVLAQETMALSADIEAEEERIAEEKRQEALRVAEEERLEKERMAREKREEERVAEEKRQTAEKAETVEEEKVMQVVNKDEKNNQNKQKEKAAEKRRQEKIKAEKATAKAREEESARKEKKAAKEREEAARKAAAERAEAARIAAEKAKAEKEKEEASTSSNGGWLRPASGYFSSSYGYRIHPVTHERGSFHNGLDIAGGGPIRAARAGRVVAASYSGTYGNRVIIDHGDGYRSLYAHMQTGLSVSVGQSVSQGQQLGIMGTTGRSTGVHLHFIVYKNGRTVNPAHYIR
ncbi:peptidoglycan DD-metalloendopeptidase family protein [Alkalibacterium gilvum]|uniref:peptidoglycan DD-metalloendopeptidase family protein n=1 Tax=Alkalibacterium gilvum TaxID=1130080 RepID=UPI003F90BDFC